MHDPEVSIVMPVYNSEQYVGDAIQSLLVQTFRNFELIVVDDGSTDRSSEIIHGFSDSRILVLKNDSNRGIVFSRNRGLAAMNGKYYAPFDSDDTAVPDKFEKQVNFLEKNPDIAMTGSWAMLCDEKGNRMLQKWKLNARPEMIPSIMLFRNYFVHSSVLVRQDAIKNMTYQEGFDVVEDYRFCADLAFGQKVFNFPGYLISYRIHQNSAMRSNSKRMQNQDRKIYRYLFDTLKIKLSESEMDCIFALKGKDRFDDFKTLRELHSFLLHVLSQNRKLNLFNRTALERTVADRWLKACFLAKSHHVKMLSMLISSPLTRLLVKS